MCPRLSRGRRTNSRLRTRYVPVSLAVRRGKSHKVSTSPSTWTPPLKRGYGDPKPSDPAKIEGRGRSTNSRLRQRSIRSSPFLTTREATAYLRYRSTSAIRNYKLRGLLKPVGQGSATTGGGRRDAPGNGHAHDELECRREATRYPGIFKTETVYRVRVRAIDPKIGHGHPRRLTSNS
jgi:hypothetical protein